jgi:hypothetical protein
MIILIGYVCSFSSICCFDSFIYEFLFLLILYIGY